MKKFFDQICVIGLGFVGLTTALSFTNKNLKVLAIDKDNELIRKLKKSKIPFKEPSLNKKLKEALSKKKIVFQSNLKLSKSKKYIFFICVGTPVNKKKFLLNNLILFSMVLINLKFFNFITYILYQLFVLVELFLKN